jgi:hypothetical protein
MISQPAAGILDAGNAPSAFSTGAESLVFPFQLRDIMLGIGREMEREKRRAA